MSMVVEKKSYGGSSNFSARGSTGSCYGHEFYFSHTFSFGSKSLIIVWLSSGGAWSSIPLSVSLSSIPSSGSDVDLLTTLFNPLNGNSKNSNKYYIK